MCHELCYTSNRENAFILIDKINLVKLTIRTAISSHKVMGMSLKKCWLCKIYHAEYGPSLASDWLKIKGSGRVMGLRSFTVERKTLIK